MNTSDELNLRHEHAEVVKNAIVKAMIQDIPYLKATLENRDTAIRVVDEHWDLNIWIRLYHIEDFAVEFSTVELPEEYRRKGIFTKVFEALKKEELIKEIRVTSVVTEEMKNWCIKNNFINKSEVDYTYKTKTI